MSDLSLDLTSLARAFDTGFTPARLVDLVFERIAGCGDPGIFITLASREEALAQARALGSQRDPGRPLWGIPCAIKDNIDVAGLPTTAACPAFGYLPAEDAACVARLRAAGALIVGKTNLDQFATGLVGTRTPYPVPKNAFDPRIVPGGSSSGSAVAVARGLVSFALGTDTAGSGRVPAGLNNIVGLKPSLGSVSARGVVPACRTLDTVSVFATTVDDAWKAYRTIAAYDAADAFSKPSDVGDLAVPARLRLGIPASSSRHFGGDALAERAFEAALVHLDALGASFVEVDLAPFFATTKLLYEGAFIAERFAATRAMIEDRPDDLLSVTRGIIESARRFSAADAFDAWYARAGCQRRTAAVWSEIDALVVPTYPRPRTVADLATDPLGPNAELGTYTNFVNLLDLCGLAVPGPFRDDGFPSGITLLAPTGADARLGGIAAAFHAQVGVPLGATGAPQPVAPRVATPAARLPPQDIEIAVVGAHMSGMALNHELVSRGGHFLRTATTREHYRLFALPGGPPRRPGLLRVAGHGHAIACEVWSLPAEGFGTFVAGVPSPLTIGTVRLDDGTTPKGFLVESEAVAGAEDISQFGGWRSYMQAQAA